jgi:hypothetical protein
VALGVSLAFGLGMAGALSMAGAGALTRREEIARLALEPQAYEVPEVSSYGRRLTAPSERQRLVAWIVEIIEEEAIPGSWYLTDRVVRYADELSALSHDLADPRAQIRPASAAAAHRLLTQAVESPLYNPSLPDDALPTIIAKIRLGISRAHA